MSQNVIDMLRSMNALGRRREANHHSVGPVIDAFLEERTEDDHATRFLRLLARLAATFPGRQWVVFIQGKVWWSVSVYERAPVIKVGGARKYRFDYPRRVMLGRARCRIVRDEERMEWQGRFDADSGGWFSQERRGVTSLLEVIETREKRPFIDPDKEDPWVAAEQTARRDREVRDQMAADREAMDGAFLDGLREQMHPDGDPQEPRRD